MFWHLLAPIAIVLAAVAVLVWGSAPNFGAVGSQNIVRQLTQDTTLDRLAEAMSASNLTPPVTDELLREAFAAVVERAQGGDLEAIELLFRIAEAQRERAAEAP